MQALFLHKITAFLCQASKGQKFLRPLYLAVLDSWPGYVNQNFSKIKYSTTILKHVAEGTFFMAAAVVHSTCESK